VGDNRFMVRGHGSEIKEASHEPDGRASLSPASRVGRFPDASSGLPGRTRPTGFLGRAHGSEIKAASREPALQIQGGPQIEGEPFAARPKFVGDTNGFGNSRLFASVCG